MERSLSQYREESSLQQQHAVPGVFLIWLGKASAYLSHTLTGRKQMRGNYNNVRERFLAWNSFWGFGNLIPWLTFYMPLDFVSGRKITVWPSMKTEWIHCAYLHKSLGPWGFSVLKKKALITINKISSTHCCIISLFFKHYLNVAKLLCLVRNLSFF